uniref:GATA-type domain-containing protein n=1 Tax=Meloidogyne hapla TaxID=6305 RepID=A0A1I8B9L0_MELHA
MERKKRHCLNCGVTKTSFWRRHPENKKDLCNACGKKQQIKVHNELGDRKCDICGTTKTPNWRRHSENKQYLCNACGITHHGYNKTKKIFKRKNFELKNKLERK